LDGQYDALCSGRRKQKGVLTAHGTRENGPVVQDQLSKAISVLPIDGRFGAEVG
jgi:hypothetical protein